MADLTLTATWDAGVYRLEVTDPVQGGEMGISNKNIKNLGNRTEWLKKVVDNMIGGSSGENHCVLTSKRNFSGPYMHMGPEPDYIVDNTTNVLIKATATEPFSLVCSMGYDSTGLKTKYFYTNVDIPVVRPTVDGYHVLVYDPVLNEFNFFALTSYGDFKVSFVQPDHTTVKNWYDLNSEVNKKWNGSAWVVEPKIILGTVVVGTGVFEYIPRNDCFMKSYNKLYGNKLVEPGSIEILANNAANTFYGGEKRVGRFVCDGGAISRADYPILFGMIGTTYGAGNGTTTFNLPDLRGEFVRGFSDGRASVDVGRTFGSSQTDMIKSHTHSLVAPTGTITTAMTGVGVTVNTNESDDTGASGGVETRPRNVAMLYLIKY